MPCEFTEMKQFPGPGSPLPGPPPEELGAVLAAGVFVAVEGLLAGVLAGELAGGAAPAVEGLLVGVAPAGDPWPAVGAGAGAVELPAGVPAFGLAPLELPVRAFAIAAISPDRAAARPLGSAFDPVAVVLAGPGVAVDDAGVGVGVALDGVLAGAGVAPGVAVDGVLAGAGVAPGVAPEGVLEGVLAAAGVVLDGVLAALGGPPPAPIPPIPPLEDMVIPPPAVRLMTPPATMQTLPCAFSTMSPLAFTAIFPPTV
jgi:hypothetical protein